MSGHHHDHEHDHVDAGPPLSDLQLRVRALESLLIDKGLVDPVALDALIDTYERLATEIAAARARGEHDDGTRYYHYWLAALEKLVAEKNLVAKGELATRKHEWDVAARSTPHGQPITLPGRPG